MDYNILRKIVATCVEGKGDNKYFRVNIVKLAKKLKKLGLIPVVYKDEFISKNLECDDLFLFVEYFKEDKLKWFDGDRTFLSLLFIREEDMDEQLQDLLYELYNMKKNSDTDDNNTYRQCCCFCKKDEIRKIDEKSILISIMSKYPCYFAIIAKWVKEDCITLNIRFRASSLLINSEKENDGVE